MEFHGTKTLDENVGPSFQRGDAGCWLDNIKEEFVCVPTGADCQSRNRADVLSPCRRGPVPWLRHVFQTAWEPSSVDSVNRMKFEALVIRARDPLSVGPSLGHATSQPILNSRFKGLSPQSGARASLRWSSFSVILLAVLDRWQAAD